MPGNTIHNARPLTTDQLIVHHLQVPCSRRTDAQIEQICAYLVDEGLGFLLRLPAQLQLDVSKWLHLEKFERGEVITEQGDDADWLHIVLSGRVTMYHKGHFAQHGEHSMDEVSG